MYRLQFHRRDVIWALKVKGWNVMKKRGKQGIKRKRREESFNPRRETGKILTYPNDIRKSRGVGGEERQQEPPRSHFRFRSATPPPRVPPRGSLRLSSAVGTHTAGKQDGKVSSLKCTTQTFASGLNISSGLKHGVPRFWRWHRNDRAGTDYKSTPASFNSLSSNGKRAKR